jgi:hypothetical protein
MISWKIYEKKDFLKKYWTMENVQNISGSEHTKRVWKV